jgi:N-methylhydantoinase B/oxoprolinase/acetone carboxylase alpha subunit
MKAGEVLIVESAGGGGYGPPSGRTPARLEADLADGYVTPEGSVRYQDAAGRDNRVGQGETFMRRTGFVGLSRALELPLASRCASR